MIKRLTPKVLFFSVLLFFLLSGCNNATRFIFKPGQALAPLPGTIGLQYKVVWFEAPDGTKLHGWLIPGDPAAPMVLFFHGNAANITHRLPNIEYLHQLGLSVFIFDYRGFGKSNGVSLREKDLYQDARGALKWLQESEWGSSKGLIYYGRSMGATVALQMALEQPPAGIILECPFTSLHDIAMKMNPVSYGLVGRWFIKDRFDNKNKISSISVPILIFHGKKDRIVPFWMSLKLYSLAKEPKALHLVNQAGHSNCYLTGGEEYKKLWISFIGKYSKYNCIGKLTKNRKQRHSKGRIESY